jgi:hypothetical protein
MSETTNTRKELRNLTNEEVEVVRGAFGCFIDKTSTPNVTQQDWLDWMKTYYNFTPL